MTAPATPSKLHGVPVVLRRKMKDLIVLERAFPWENHFAMDNTVNSKDSRQ